MVGAGVITKTKYKQLSLQRQPNVRNINETGIERAINHVRCDSKETTTQWKTLQSEHRKTREIDVPQQCGIR